MLQLTNTREEKKKKSKYRYFTFCFHFSRQEEMTTHTYSTCLHRRTHTSCAHTHHRHSSGSEPRPHHVTSSLESTAGVSLTCQFLQSKAEKPHTTHTHMYRARKPSLSVLLLSNGLNRGKGSGANSFYFRDTRGASGNHFVSYFFVFRFLFLVVFRFHFSAKSDPARLSGQTVFSFFV